MTHSLHDNILKKFKYNRLLYILLLLITFIFDFANAQTDFDSKGKDFWLTFIPNFHSKRYEDDTFRVVQDSIYIYIATEAPAKGKIEYRDANGKNYTKPFTITDPKKIFVFSLCYYNFELNGVNNGGVSSQLQQRQDEEVAPQSFHVVSDTDVTVYALNQADLTSEAFLVLPTDVLGKEYLVLSYNSDDAGGVNAPGRTPSQFAVVATEDNTELTIIPSDITYANDLNTQTVILNKGDSYLVQAKFDFFNDAADLTGSDIISTKPVAVFAGHQRASLPLYLNRSSGSRDCLIEQMQPFNTWGKNAFIVPFLQLPDMIASGNDIFRVLACYDSTNIYINGNYVVTLNKGGFYEGNAQSVWVVTSDRAISVAQYKRTSGTGSNPNQFKMGDPFMLIIPPWEQYLNNYRIVNIQAYEMRTTGVSTKVYINQVVTIIAQDTTLYSLKQDGNTVDPNQFIKIPYSDGYSYANIIVTDGVHNFNANGKFEIYIYGYGQANSYGYVGGMNFRPINFKPPSITAFDSCFSKTGYSYQTNKTDPLIVKLRLDSADNIDMAIQPYDAVQKRINYSAVLKDNRKDGSFSVTVIDSIGAKTSATYDVPGYTIALKNNILADTILHHGKTLKRYNQYCKSVTLTNYGKFKHLIKELRFKNNIDFTTNKSTPFSLGPNENVDINLCFMGNKDSTWSDTLLLVGDCGSSPLIALDYSIVGDTNKPVILKKAEPCDTIINITISDSLETDYGIQTLTTDKNNCDIQTTLIGNNLAKINIRIVDPLKDAYYSIIAIDSSGNKRAFADTIQGYTLSIGSADPSSRIIDFGKIVIGSMVCDSVKVTNYGMLPFRFEKLHLAQNVEFSLPQSQLPFIINPNETKILKVCFKPNVVVKNPMRDSISFDFRCFNTQLKYIGTPVQLVRDGSSECDLPITITSKSVPQNFFADGLYPNPASGKGIVYIGSPSDDILNIRIYNTNGIFIKELSNISLQAGLSELSIDLNELANGSYYAIIQNKDQSIAKQFFVIK